MLDFLKTWGYYLDGDYKGKTEDGYISAKKNAEIEQQIVSMLMTYQRTNVFYL